MKKLCPECNTIQDAISFKLSDKEILNMIKLDLSENLCSSCYKKLLSSRLADAKAELIPLNKEKEITQAAYYEAYNSWKEKAKQYKDLDYNLSLMTHTEQKKATVPKQTSPKDPKPLDVNQLAKKILANLSKEEQDNIMKAFQAVQQL